MQFFKDSITNIVWSFDDHVKQATVKGVLCFLDINGDPMHNIPVDTLVPYTPPVDTPAMILAKAIAAQSQVISTSCANAITAGFMSSALGTPYLYPFNTTDQLNLGNNVLSSMYPGLPTTWTTPQMCATVATATSTAIWAYVDHTAAQIQKVGLDAKAYKVAQLLKNETLQAQLAAATTTAAVALIAW